MAVQPTEWTEKISQIDAAIRERDVTRAMLEWRKAYGTALRSREWSALADMGDAGTRIEASAGAAGKYRAEARQAYVEALYRARVAHSREGMLRAASGFAALGDAEAAELARRMAGAGPS